MDINEELIKAARNGDTETAQLLLDRGADVHAWNDWALRVAARNGHTETVMLLLDRGADTHIWGDWALRRAIENGHTETVLSLLDRGANVHVYSSALRRAAENGRTETVLSLLDRGADYDNQETRKHLRKILEVKRLPGSRDKLIDMLRIVSIHKE